MLNTSVTTVTAVQGSERQHLKDEGQGVAKELSNEVDVPRKIRRKLEVWHGNITMKGIRIAFWMTAKRYLKKHEIKQNVFCLIFYTLRHVVCVFSFLKWSRMIWLPNESCIIGPRQVTTRLILTFCLASWLSHPTSAFPSSLIQHPKVVLSVSSKRMGSLPT